MNKKAQYYQPEPYSSVHPVLVIGIIIFVIPFFNGVLHWSIPKWVSGVGIIVILIGSILSIMNAMNR